MSSCVIQIRIDERVKKRVDRLFEKLGFDTPTAVRMFLAQSLKTNGLPFDVRLSNGKVETLNAIDEIENQIRNKNGQIFRDTNELFESLEI